MDTKRVIGYARASTKKQELSIPAQEMRLREWAAREGIENFEILSDPATTSGIPWHKRPSGKLLVEAIASHSVSAVVAVRMDRIYRSLPELAVAMKELWAKTDCSLIILDMGGQPVDTQTPMGKFMASVLAAIGQLEKERTGERTADVLESLRKSNKRFSRHAPYGWRTEGKELVEEPKEQEVIQVVKECMKKGKGCYRTEKELRARGHTNRNGQPFNLATIWAIRRRLGAKRTRKNRGQTIDIANLLG